MVRNGGKTHAGGPGSNALVDRRWSLVLFRDGEYGVARRSRCDGFRRVLLGIAGAVDLGLERTHKGYGLPDGHWWYTIALSGGFIVAYISMASLTDTAAERYTALVPAAGAWFGVAS